MKFFISVIIIFISCQFSVAGEDGLRVTDAWTRPVMMENRPIAVYFTIHNDTNKDDKLIKAVSALATRIEFHTHTHENGVMRMMAVKNIAIAANSSVKVEPGGYHLMVYGLSMKFALGSSFPLVLDFANGARVPVTARVMKRAPKK